MHPVPAAKDAIKTLLAVRPAFEDVDIQDGRPTEFEDYRKDAFWFEPTVIAKDGWAAVGGGRRRLTFTLNYVISCRRHGDHERRTEDDVWEFFEDFMEMVKANHTLDGSVQMTQDVTARQENAPDGAKKWQAILVGSITCLSLAY